MVICTAAWPHMNPYIAYVLKLPLHSSYSHGNDPRSLHAISASYFVSAVRSKWTIEDKLPIAGKYQREKMFVFLSIKKNSISYCLIIRSRLLSYFHDRKGKRKHLYMLVCLFDILHSIKSRPQYEVVVVISKDHIITFKL